MSLSISYNLRHLLAKKITTAMTVGGIALVVFVAVATMMLAQGLRETLASTGSAGNAMIIRNGAQNEIQSGIAHEDTNVILADAAAARFPDGSPIATTDVVVLVSLTKRADNQRSNVNVRGVSAPALSVRTEVKVIEGRFPARGTNEVMVGRAIHDKFNSTDIGRNVRLMGHDFPVVGIFSAGNSGFNSEIWGDSDILIRTFKREQFSSITLRLKPDADFEAMKTRIEGDRRLGVVVKRETDYFAGQSQALADFIRLMGAFVSAVFSLGAILGAMITMYSAVASRTREIGILRALGFNGWQIFFAFLKECLAISLIGGVAGVLLASVLSFVGVSTGNFRTFSEIAFGFALTPGIALKGILFALAMGIVGGALPALHAARIHILSALRPE